MQGFLFCRSGIAYQPKTRPADFDLIYVTPNRCTVLFQDLQLALKYFRELNVFQMSACVATTFKFIFSPGGADQYGRVRLPDRFGFAPGILNTVVLAVDGRLLLCPEAFDNSKRLFEPADALSGCIRKGSRKLCVPDSNQPEPIPRINLPPVA